MLPSLSLLAKASRLWLLKLFSDTRAAAEASMAAGERVVVAALVYFLFEFLPGCPG